MLWSQFSAIFDNFRQKIGVFLKNQCYDHFLQQIVCSSLSEKRQFFAIFLAKIFTKIVTSVPGRMSRSAPWDVRCLRGRYEVRDSRRYKGRRCYARRIAIICKSLPNSFFQTLLDAGLPDFSWYNIPKREKYTKWAQNVTKGHKSYQLAVKCTK
jgi:hypothetical protein